MGSEEDEEKDWEAYSERPRHLVTLTRDFWLGEVPCTQALWAEVMDADNPSEFQDPERPVENVSWDDVQVFLERLDLRLPDLRARLPAEAEWEYACRAETTAATYAGPLDIKGLHNAPVLDLIAGYGGNNGFDFDLEGGFEMDLQEQQYPFKKAGTRKVGLRRPNPWGLFDMLGNVWEWCQDWHGTYAQSHPSGPDRGDGRVVRGGAWDSNARLVRAAARSAVRPSTRNPGLGFRLARGQEEAGPGGGAEARRDAERLGEP